MNASPKPAIMNGETLQDLYPEGVDWNTELQKITLVEMFNVAVKKYADLPCIDFYGRKYSFNDLDELTDKAAKGFQDMGVKKGTRVGFYMPNTPWHPILFFGALKAGAVIVNYSPLYAEQELANQVEDSGTDILITADIPANYKNATRLLKDGKLDKVLALHLADTMPKDKSWLPKDLKWGLPVYKILNKFMAIFNFAVRGKVSYVNQMIENDGQYEKVAIDPEDTAVLQYTGGTTGTPKGAELTHYNIAANVQQIEAFFSANPGRPESAYSIKHGETKMAAPLPNFHVFGMTTTMIMPVHMGMEVSLFLNPRDFETMMKVIEKTKPDFAAAVPKQVEGAIYNKAIHKYDHSSLKGVVTGGAATSSSLHKTIGENCEAKVFEGWGLTETAPVLTANPPEGAKVGAAGLPLPGVEIRICDIEHPEKVLNIGDTGEIQARGPNVMRGYWNKPEETAEVMTADGWFRTGDVGHLAEDGFVHITDRLKRMINVAGTGKKAWCSTIEDEITKHDDVLECIVVAVKKGTDHESAKAFIRPMEGRKVDEKDIKEFLERRLSKHAIPRFYEFVTEPLPVKDTGKLDWKKLEDAEAAKEKENNGASGLAPAP